MTDYILEPEDNLKVIIPRTLHTACSKPKVCILNITDTFIKLKRDQLVATAFPVCKILPVPVDSSGEVGVTSPQLEGLVQNLVSDITAEDPDSQVSCSRPRMETPFCSPGHLTGTPVRLRFLYLKAE